MLSSNEHTGLSPKSQYVFMAFKEVYLMCVFMSFVMTLLQQHDLPLKQCPYDIKCILHTSKHVPSLSLSLQTILVK
jgi:hypothetical protein